MGDLTNRKKNMASDQQCMGRYWENNPHMGLSENGKLCINQCIFGEPG